MLIQRDSVHDRMIRADDLHELRGTLGLVRIAAAGSIVHVNAPRPFGIIAESYMLPHHHRDSHRRFRDIGRSTAAGNDNQSYVEIRINGLKQAVSLVEGVG